MSSTYRHTAEYDWYVNDKKCRQPGISGHEIDEVSPGRSHLLEPPSYCFTAGLHIRYARRDLLPYARGGRLPLSRCTSLVFSLT
jgi:hypothetical protein